MRVPVAADRLAVLVVVAPGLLRVGDCAAVVEVAAAGCAAGLAFCGLRGGWGQWMGWLVGGRGLTVEMGMERVVVVRRVRARRDWVGVSWMVLMWDGEGRKGGNLDGWHNAGG